MKLHGPGLESLLFPLTHYQRYPEKTDRQRRKRTDRREIWIPLLRTTLSWISEKSFCIAWRFAVITQLPKWRVLSPVTGVQMRKPTAENRTKAKLKPLIFYLDPGKQRWKFKEIRTIGFSSQSSKNRSAPGVPWVGTRQPSLAASNAMCSHSVLRKAASDRSLPWPSGPRCWVVPWVMAPLLCHLPCSTVTASREGLERQTLAVNRQTMTFQKKCQNLFEGIDADTHPFQKAIATPFVVLLDLQGKTVSQKLWPCHQKYLGENYQFSIGSHKKPEWVGHTISVCLLISLGFIFLAQNGDY